MGRDDKVYVLILQHLHKWITSEGLKSGDKIPSERDLADMLHVGRSSVREALRSLELLGIIETKRGEGTFISEIGDHRFISFLAPYLLSDQARTTELLEVRRIVETNGLHLAIAQLTDEDHELLSTLVRRENVSSTSYTMDAFFHLIMTRANNSLLFRIWQAVVEFAKSYFEPGQEVLDILRQLLLTLKDQNEKELLALYKSIPWLKVRHI